MKQNAMASVNPNTMMRADAAHGGGTVLVWDRDPLSLLATAGALHHGGFRCVCCRSRESLFAALDQETLDVMVIDVADDAPIALETVQAVREREPLTALPAILLAETRWSGLQFKCEKMTVATRCLFRPIDPNSLVDLVGTLGWMPTLVQHHQRQRTRPSRPGWVTLD